MAIIRHMKKPNFGGNAARLLCIFQVFVGNAEASRFALFKRRMMSF